MEPKFKTVWRFLESTCLIDRFCSAAFATVRNAYSVHQRRASFINRDIRDIFHINNMINASVSEAVSVKSK